MPLSVQKILIVCSTVFMVALCGGGMACCTVSNLHEHDKRVECVKLGSDPDACRRLFYGGS